MTKDELLIWAQDNIWEYPALDKLREEVIYGVEFLFLPGKHGAYKGLYLCFCENSTVLKLRNAKYAVGIVKDYETARDIILDCVQFTKNWESAKKEKKF